MPIGNGGIIGPANVPTLLSAKGVWSLREAQLAQRQGIWPLGLIPDPYFEYTTLLLPGNGTNGAQNNTFLDASTNNFTITRNGNTTQGTFSPFSQTGWGNYFNGSSRFNLASNVALTPGSGDFTIECWIYPTAAFSTYNGIFVGDATGAMNFGKISGGIGLRISGTSDIISATAPSINQWTHVAITRSGTDVRLFYNGEQQGSTVTNSTNFVQSATSIGDNGGGTAYWNGYISNLRFVKGTAVYTSNFTPSATPLTAISNTQLLTCQSNRFIDNSTNAFTLTPNGSPSVQAFSPFNPLLPWTAANNGGSGYFDGSGDYLTTPSNSAFAFGTGNFTVEAWIYIVQTNSANTFLLTTAGVSSDFSFYLSSSRQLTVWNGSANTTLGGSVPLNSWNHIAFVRNGTTITGYLNGTSVGSTTDGTNLINSQTVSIGASSTYPNSQTVYYSGLRVVKGTAVYTAAFTPPTAPLTAITNTSLLLNYTNAGIYDATSKNDLETVGNAQISTTQSKWGGSSIYVDGTGDYLAGATRSSVYFNLTGDFTIETWAYFTTVATGFAGIVSWTDSSGFNGWELINNAGTVYFRFLTGSAGVGQVTASSAISANQWYYISVIRSGSTITLYINGSSVGSTTYSGSQTSESSFLKVGADRVGTSLMTGYLQDMRISKYVRPTTVPTAPFPRQ
jgi:hypothetical protein